MGLLDRFKRNQKKSVLPKEVQQYYQSETRQRRGVAIGLAIVALIVTVAVAAGLFFGGRAIYNQIFGDNDKSNTSKQDDNKDFGVEQKPEDNANKQSQQPAQNQPAPTPAPAPQPAPAPNPTTPALGDEALPHTGDEGM